MIQCQEKGACAGCLNSGSGGLSLPHLHPLWVCRPLKAHLDVFNNWKAPHKLERGAAWLQFMEMGDQNSWKWDEHS